VFAGPSSAADSCSHRIADIGEQPTVNVFADLEPGWLTLREFPCSVCGRTMRIRRKDDVAESWRKEGGAGSTIRVTGCASNLFNLKKGDT